MLRYIRRDFHEYIYKFNAQCLNEKVQLILDNPCFCFQQAAHCQAAALPDLTSTLDAKRISPQHSMRSGCHHLRIRYEDIIRRKILDFFPV